MREVWEQIEALDNRVPAKLQYEAAFQTSRLLRHATYWLLVARRSGLQVDAAVAEFRAGRAAARGRQRAGARRSGAASASRKARRHFIEGGLPPHLAVRIASLEALNAALDIVEISAAHRVSVVETARVYLRGRHAARRRLAARAHRETRGRRPVAGDRPHRAARCGAARASPSHRTGAVAQGPRRRAGAGRMPGSTAAARSSRTGSARSPTCAPPAQPTSRRSPSASSRCASWQTDRFASGSCRVSIPPRAPGRLILVRHGQSIWNVENLFTGWTDVDLSAPGRAEAAQAGRELLREQLEVRMAFTSVLKRAIRTLWIMLDEMDRMWLPVERSWRLNERHYGALQGLNKAQTVGAARRGAGEDLASQLRHPAAAARRRRSAAPAHRSALRGCRSRS